MKLYLTFIFLGIFLFKLQAQEYLLNNYNPVTSDSIFLAKPKWDNSGNLLLATGEHNTGVYTINITDRSINLISDKRGLGSKVSWSSDNSIVTVRNNKIELVNNNYRTKVACSDTLVYVDLKKKQVILSNTNQSFQKEITSSPALYYNVLISPDKKWIVAHLRSEIILFSSKSKGDSIKVGTGIASSWSPDSKYLFYFLDESKDGHSISNSELYAYSLSDNTISKLTQTDDYTEMWPSVSPDGSKLAFSDGKTGIIYITDLNRNE